MSLPRQSIQPRRPISFVIGPEDVLYIRVITKRT